MGGDRAANDFNSRLCMRGNTSEQEVITEPFYFNSRLCMRGNNLVLLYQVPNGHFNSRLCMRGNYVVGDCTTSSTKFQFTPLHERQPDSGKDGNEGHIFQFTPLHERQQGRLFLWEGRTYFNSRLCMRGNAYPIRTNDFFTISIHASA